METYPVHNMRAWNANFRVEKWPILYERRTVEIRETRLGGQTYFWHTVDTVGVWPGAESPEWIEYIPEGETSC
jgi:hypothetical protein